jgi:hypothetical protein
VRKIAEKIFENITHKLKDKLEMPRSELRKESQEFKSVKNKVDVQSLEQESGVNR